MDKRYDTATLEWPDCGALFLGEEPRIVTLCSDCETDELGS